MLKNIKERIEYTGYEMGEEEDAIFNKLVLSQEELEFIQETSNINDFVEKYSLDFISVQKDEEIKFIHFSDIENYDSIKESGLMVMLDNTWVPDLGVGIYVVKEKDINAINNVVNYLSDIKSYENDKILKIKGYYNGYFEECIYGEGHVGYILITKKRLL